MKIRTILPISAFLLTACAHTPAREVARPIERPSISASTTTPSHPVYTALSALTQILSCEPNVVSFGDIHRRNVDEQFIPISQQFAKEILPHLPTFGIKDLVVEFLPDDPTIDAELATFRERGSLGEDTPIINQWIYGWESSAKLEILMVAREKGITIHGGNMSLAECPDPNKIPEMFEQDPSQISNLVRDHMAQKMNAILTEGRSVASFSGIRHNNYAPESWDAEASFGDEFIAQPGVRYVEVDLVVPELIEGHELQIGLNNPQSYIPSSGVTLVDHSPRYVIFFPSSL